MYTTSRLKMQLSRVIPTRDLRGFCAERGGVLVGFGSR